MRKPIRTVDLRAALTALWPALGDDIPALRAVRCEPGRIRANDYATTVEVVSPLLAGLPRATVDGADLVAAVRACTAPAVTIVNARGRTMFTADGLSMPLTRIPDGDVPAWPSWPEWMPVHRLTPRQMDRVRRCATATTDSVNALPSLSCVQLADTDGTLTAAGTDLERLAVARLGRTADRGWSLLVPAGVLRACGHDAAVEVWGPAPTTGEAAPRVRASLRRLDALGPGSMVEQSWIVEPHAFPAWSALIPTGHAKQATVNRAELLDALHAITTARSTASGPVQITKTGDRLTLAAYTNGFPSQPTGVTAAVTVEGEWVTRAYNPDHLATLARACTGRRLTLACAGMGRPLVLTGRDQAMRYVLMPYRLLHKAAA